MKRIAWLTDIHLNFLPVARVDEFLHAIAATEPDAVLIGGDIGESQDVAYYLQCIDDVLAVPVYFVLGNHDYYHSSIATVRERVSRVCAERPRLHYLTQSEVIELTPNVGLVGHDGWADARLGDYERSLISMNDYQLIADLSGLNKPDRRFVLQKLGDEAAAHVRRFLPVALDRYPQVLLLTHVPPLGEACWHEGRLSDDQWAPHFTCKAVGDAVLEIMRTRPDRRLTVLCGHTHGSGQAQPLPNVEILTGGADYGRPEIQRVFTFE